MSEIREFDDPSLERVRTQTVEIFCQLFDFGLITCDGWGGLALCFYENERCSNIHRFHAWSKLTPGQTGGEMN
jgi:hypothetical protein